MYSKLLAQPAVELFKVFPLLFRCATRYAVSLWQPARVALVVFGWWIPVGIRVLDIRIEQSLKNAPLLR